MGRTSLDTALAQTIAWLWLGFLVAGAVAALDLFVEAGLVEEAERPEIMQRIAVTIDGRSAAKGVGLVMECISENRDAKKALYEQLDQWCPEDTVFASNTSHLNIFDLVPASRLPRTLIAHWFAPAHILPLVEETGEGLMPPPRSQLSSTARPFVARRAWAITSSAVWPGAMR